MDDTGPLAPVLDGVEVEGEYFGGLTCPEASRATVRVATAEDVLVLLPASARPAMGPEAIAMGRGYQVRAVDLAEGDHDLQLVAFDLAGHASATRVPTFTVPNRQSGCATTSSPASVTLLALVGLVLASRRRQRQARSVTIDGCG